MYILERFVVAKPDSCLLSVFSFPQTCEQHLSSRHGRRAVVMRKKKAYDRACVVEYQAYKARVMQGEVSREQCFEKCLLPPVAILASVL